MIFDQDRMYPTFQLTIRCHERNRGFSMNSIIQQRPYLLFLLLLVLDKENLCRCEVKSFEYLARVTVYNIKLSTEDVLIGSVDLSPCFLEDGDPNLRLGRRGKEGLS